MVLNLKCLLKKLKRQLTHDNIQWNLQYNIQQFFFTFTEQFIKHFNLCTNSASKRPTEQASIHTDYKAKTCEN